MKNKKFLKIIAFIYLISTILFSGCNNNLLLDTSEYKESEASQEVEEKSAENSQELICSILIRCEADTKKLKEEKQTFALNDGIIFSKSNISFKEGETALDILLRQTQENGISLDYEKSSIYNSVYIKAIGGLNEFDAGDMSGWKYMINGEYPNYACSSYEVKNGDKIEFIFN